MSLFLYTMQQTPGPVKRVHLQLSGSNLQPTTQSHSKTPWDNKGPRRLNGKCSDLTGCQFTPRHQETWNNFPHGLEEAPYWKLQVEALPLSGYYNAIHWRLLNKFKVKCFFSFLKHSKCFASLCCLVITLPAKTPVKLRLLINRGPDQSGGCLISIWQLPDQSGSSLILP